MIIDTWFSSGRGRTARRRGEMQHLIVSRSALGRRGCAPRHVGFEEQAIRCQYRFATLAERSIPARDRFKDRDAERLFRGLVVRRLPPEIQRRARMRLQRSVVAKALSDLRLPLSHRLEALSGDRWGQHSIRINDQWRVCFR